MGSWAEPITEPSWQCLTKQQLHVHRLRFNFIRKISSINQEFHYCTADVKLKLYNIYAMSLYGSCLWDLFSEKCERLYKAWNVSVRIALNVSRYTHRYLIEPVSKTLHPKVILCSRFVKFHNTLQAHSSKPAVKFLSKICTNDLRTTYGSNLYKISNGYWLFPLLFTI